MYRNSSSLPRTRHDHVRGHIARRYVRKLDPVSVSAQITTLLRLHYRNRGRSCAAAATSTRVRLLYSLGAFLREFLGRKSTSDNTTSRTGSRTITIRSCRFPFASRGEFARTPVCRCGVTRFGHDGHTSRIEYELRRKRTLAYSRELGPE